MPFRIAALVASLLTGVSRGATAFGGFVTTAPAGAPAPPPPLKPYDLLP